MIDIQDDVPLPDDGWTSAPTKAELQQPAVRNVYERKCEYVVPQPGPNDCTFIGGPLNGKFGPLRDNDKKVVEIEIYNPDGSVASVELYALNDTHPTPTFRVHVGSKQP